MVADGLRRVQRRAAAAATRAGRDPAEIVLVAVSKTVGPAEIMEAYNMGHRDFGENRSHELAAKAQSLPDDINWHFVGTIQSRKAKEVAHYAAVVHSIDHESLLRAWAKTGSSADLLLQINLAGEAQKHGTEPAAASQMLTEAAALGLAFSGLMVFPPLAPDPESNRVWFRKLREMRGELQPEYPSLVDLSMGMTDDFEVAIEEGATLIRVGRAIFGT